MLFPSTPLSQESVCRPLCLLFIQVSRHDPIAFRPHCFSDLIILHKKTSRYYGIEIGTLKERQSGGFMAPSGIPVIPLDTFDERQLEFPPDDN